MLRLHAFPCEDILPQIKHRGSMTIHPKSRFAIALVATLTAGTSLAAQQPAVAAVHASPEVGAMAPDFALPGATRYGLLRDPVRVSDLRGKTVVLAFFYRARTKG